MATKFPKNLAKVLYNIQLPGESGAGQITRCKVATNAALWFMAERIGQVF